MVEYQSSEPNQDEAQSAVVKAYATTRTHSVLETVDMQHRGVILTFLNEAQLIEKKRPIVDLDDAGLYGADLSGVNLTATDLSGPILIQADLRNADLSGMNLSGANLKGAQGVNADGLEQQAISLEDATMPNGQKYEDWPKDKEG